MLSQHSTERALLGLCTLQWEREPKVDVQLLQHCGTLCCRLIQVLLHRDHRGNVQRSITGNQRWRRVGCIARCTPILVDHTPDCGGTQAEIPASSSAQLQSWAGGPIWPGSFIGSSAWFRSPGNWLYHLWSPFYMLGMEINLQPCSTV